jgi:hypothetical protein
MLRLREMNDMLDVVRRKLSGRKRAAAAGDDPSV